MTDRPAILDRLDGFVVVPKEPTDEMVGVGKAYPRWDVSYAAMLNARSYPNALAEIAAHVAGLEARLAEAEKVIDQVTDIYGNMEDGDGNPCDVIRAARAWKEGK